MNLCKGRLDFSFNCLFMIVYTTFKSNVRIVSEIFNSAAKSGHNIFHAIAFIWSSGIFMFNTRDTKTACPKEDRAQLSIILFQLFYKKWKKRYLYIDN